MTVLALGIAAAVILLAVITTFLVLQLMRKEGAADENEEEAKEKAATDWSDCGEPGDDCTLSSCCSGLVCGTGGSCESPCAAAGSACMSTIACCEPLQCADGVCKSPTCGAVPGDSCDVSGCCNGPQLACGGAICEPVCGSANGQACDISGCCSPPLACEAGWCRPSPPPPQITTFSMGPDAVELFPGGIPKTGFDVLSFAEAANLVQLGDSVLRYHEYTTIDFTGATALAVMLPRTVANSVTLQTLKLDGLVSLKTLPNRFADNCPNLISVTGFDKMAALQTIEYSAFLFNSSLQTVDLSQNTNLRSIGADAFADTGLRTITFPQYAPPASVVLGRNVLSASNLQGTLVLPPSVLATDTVLSYIESNALLEVVFESQTIVPSMVHDVPSLTRLRFRGTTTGAATLAAPAVFNVPNLNRVIIEQPTEFSVAFFQGTTFAGFSGLKAPGTYTPPPPPPPPCGVDLWDACDLSGCCNGPQLACDGAACAPVCGAGGQACDVSGCCDGPQLTCDGARCQPVCGSALGAACEVSGCCDGPQLACDGAVCAPVCGADGQACDVSGCCLGGGMCRDGICHSCTPDHMGDCSETGCCANGLDCVLGSMCLQPCTSQPGARCRMSIHDPEEWSDHCCDDAGLKCSYQHRVCCQTHAGGQCDASAPGGGCCSLSHVCEGGVCQPDEAYCGQTYGSSCPNGCCGDGLECRNGECKYPCGDVGDKCDTILRGCCTGRECSGPGGTCVSSIGGPCEMNDHCIPGDVCEGGACSFPPAKFVQPCGKWCGDVFQWKTLDQREAENSGLMSHHLAQLRRGDIRRCHTTGVMARDESGACRPDLPVTGCHVNESGRCASV